MPKQHYTTYATKLMYRFVILTLQTNTSMYSVTIQ